MNKKQYFLSLFDNNDKTNGEYTLIEKIDAKTYIIKHNKCGNIQPIKYYKFLKGQGCNNKECINKKKKETCIANYGIDHPMHSKKIKKKIKKTNKKKYGVDHPMRSKEIKEKLEKTVFEKYGVKNVMFKNRFKDKVKKTNLERYGVEYPMQSKDIKEKSKKTNIERYGSKHISKSSKIINEKYKNFYINKICSLNNVTPLFNLEEYRGVGKKKYKWKCNKCGHIFEYCIDNGRKPLCNNCNQNIINKSKQENEIKLWLENIVDIEKNKRYYYNGKKFYEIDILSKDIGIELNGVYYHSENSGSKNKYYHINKTKFFKEMNIKIIHILDIEWNNKKDIVKSIILSKLKLINKKIYARKCCIKEITYKEAKEFHDKNHLQGYIPSKINIGLFYENFLVSCLSLSKPRFNKNYEYEITRFSSEIFSSVIGGFSKLLKYFVKKYRSNSIITYADIRFSDGNVYKKNNFELVSISQPNYFYTNNYKKLESRIKYQKHKIKNKLDYYDPKLTEWKNMQLNGYDRIWDCGNYAFSYKSQW